MVHLAEQDCSLAAEDNSDASLDAKFSAKSINLPLRGVNSASPKYDVFYIPLFVQYQQVSYTADVLKTPVRYPSHSSIILPESKVST